MLILFGIVRQERNKRNRGAIQSELPMPLVALGFIGLSMCGFYWSYAAVIAGRYIEAASLCFAAIIVMPKSIRGLLQRA